MAAIVPPLNRRRVMPVNQVINAFVDELFRSAFNHHSDYIKDSLNNDWRIQEMVADHNIDEDHECLRFVIVCAFLLGRYDVITALLERNEIDFDEELFYVKIDCLPDLLDYLVVSEKLSFDYRRILRICCSNGNLKLIRHIVEKIGYRPRENFVYITEAKDHPDVIRYFLSELKFNVNKIQESNGESYLFHVVQFRRMEKIRSETIKILLEFGIDTTIRNQDGLLAVDDIRSSHSEAIRDLIENYHDPLSVKEPEGETEE